MKGESFFMKFEISLKSKFEIMRPNNKMSKIQYLLKLKQKTIKSKFMYFCHQREGKKDHVKI